MIRSLLSGVVVLGAACASAPEPISQQELIVGAWTCKSALMTPASVLVLTFNKDGRVSLTMDAESVGQEMLLTMKMQSEGEYQLRAGWLSGAFDTVKIDHLVADGAAIPAEELPQYEQLMLDVSRISIDAPISTLDRDYLVLSKSNEGRTPLSCTRTGS